MKPSNIMANIIELLRCLKVIVLMEFLKVPTVVTTSDSATIFYVIMGSNVILVAHILVALS